MWLFRSVIISRTSNPSCAFGAALLQGPAFLRIILHCIADHHGNSYRGTSRGWVEMEAPQADVLKAQSPVVMTQIISIESLRPSRWTSNLNSQLCLFLLTFLF
jgi:hypothetical protein